MTHYFAHSSNKAGSPWEPLREHTQRVAERAQRYANAFGAGDEGEIAGLFHDLGKYSELFTKRLDGELSGLDHWSAGAFVTLGRYRAKAVAAALAIQGHHIGLQHGSANSIRDELNHSRLASPDTHPLGLTLTEPEFNKLVQRFKADRFSIPPPPANSTFDLSSKEPVSNMLDARMLYSALVDADFIETEAHFEGKSDGSKVYRTEGPKLQTAETFQIVMAHIRELERRSDSSADVKKIRNDLLNACLDLSTASRGIFTLTAPTGAGKTLAMLAFALKHAITHSEIRRIVMVIPFLSIIEQTAKIYRRLLEPEFGPHYILEHHSLIDVSKGNAGCRDCDNDEEARRTAHLLAENWDSPIVLTTNVQLFESLFANRPGKCRKLHRVANSIVLFDEVQTLPPRVAIPSLAALSRLVERYGCTVLFSTATQPAFDHLHKKVVCYARAGWQTKTIPDKPKTLFDVAHRVDIDWRINESRSWSSIAADLAGEENARSLCIVNLKRHARRLVEHLCEQVEDDNLFHLSTNMCPVHRNKVLNDVRERLDADVSRPCRLVSTQCIEAGVDVDFPVVWRAFGPLDAIAQAAGRCNREGKLDKLGRMIVFLCEKEHDGEYLYPPGGYKEAADTTKTLFSLKSKEACEQRVPINKVFDICDPGLFDDYYRLLYDLTAVTDLSFNLDDAIQRRSFIDVARHYWLIDRCHINVLVPYAPEIALFENLKARLATDGRLTRQWIRDARALTVSLYRPKSDSTIWNLLDPAPLGRGDVADDWFVYLNPKDYDPLLGLKPLDEVDAWMI